MGVVSPADMTLGVVESKYARVERERRFLLRELPPGLRVSDAHTQITDNYLTGTRLRLRKVRVPADERVDAQAHAEARARAAGLLAHAHHQHLPRPA